MKPRTLLFLFGILLFASGCGSGGNDIQLPPESELQTTSVQGISIGKPPSWSFIDREEYPDRFPKNIILLMSSVEPWGEGETFATVAVAKEDIPESTSAKKYGEAAVKKTESEIINYERISEETVTIGDIEAKYLRFKGRTAFDENQLEWQHLFIAKGNTGYVVSSTAPLDASNENKDLLRKIVLSFSFAPDTAP